MPTHSIVSATHAAQRRKLALSLPALLGLLYGCSALPSRPPAPSYFDFGLDAGETAVPASPAASASSARPVVLDSVTASGLPNGEQAVLYRYAYAGDNQLRAYQRARWSRPVGQLLEQQLLRQMTLTRPVLTQAQGYIHPSGDAAPLLLQVDVENFEQVFMSTDRSAGVARVRATLVEPDAQGGRRLIAQRRFTREIAAASPDAPGGTGALARAARDIAGAIDAWLQPLSEARRAAPSGIAKP